MERREPGVPVRDLRGVDGAGEGGSIAGLVLVLVLVLGPASVG